MFFGPGSKRGLVDITNGPCCGTADAKAVVTAAAVLMVDGVEMKRLALLAADGDDVLGTTGGDHWGAAAKPELNRGMLADEGTGGMG